jgi:hypothetical protein
LEIKNRKYYKRRVESLKTVDEFSNGEWSKAKIKHEGDLEYSK